MSRAGALALTGALLLAAVPGTARAGVATEGFRCSLMSVTDPDAPPGTYSGMVWAGPMTFRDPDDPATPVRAAVRCTVRDGWTHLAPELAYVESETTPAVAAIPRRRWRSRTRP